MKKYLKYIGLSVAIGIILSIIQHVFNIDEDVVIGYYIVFGVVFIIVITVYTSIKLRRGIKLLDTFTDAIAMNTVDEELLKEIDTFEVQRKSEPRLLNYIYINRSVYYGSLKDFKKALEEIEKVEYKYLTKQNKLIYLNNRIEFLIETGQSDTAKEIFLENKSYIDQNIHLLSSVSGINFDKYENI